MFRHIALVTALGSVFLATAAHADEPKRCKGTKSWFAGECRYPEEIKKLQAQQAAAAAAEREADKKACEEASSKDDLPAWHAYLKQRPNGACADHARARIAALEQPTAPSPDPTPPPSTEPAPPAPAPAPPPAPVIHVASAEVSPLVWIGFGVGAAGLLTWGITGGISMSQASELKDACHDGLCEPDRQSDIDSATTLAHVATAGFAVGLAGVAVGVIGLVISDWGSGPDNGLVVGPGWLGVRGEL